MHLGWVRICSHYKGGKMKITVFIVSAISLTVSQLAFADSDILIPGYHESDNITVKPIIKKQDDSRTTNDGPAMSENERHNPHLRDYDKDGIPNYKDKDDDNDGVPDNVDRYQYGK